MQEKTGQLRRQLHVWNVVVFTCSGSECGIILTAFLLLPAAGIANQQGETITSGCSGMCDKN